MRRFVIFLLFGIYSASSQALPIESSQFGDNWPFTVESGELACVNGVAIVFSTGGTDYAVNGTASTMGYSGIEPIWKLDPDMLEYAKDTAKSEGKTLEEVQSVMGKVRVNISAVLQQGLALCDSK